MVGMIFVIVVLIIVVALYFYNKNKSKSSVEHHVYENPPFGPGNKESDEKLRSTNGKKKEK
jgi:hypothetical protein